MRKVLLTLTVAMAGLGPASAADLPVRHTWTHDQHARQSTPVPGRYPLSKRAAAVRAGKGCWRACQRDTAQAFLLCMYRNPLTACVAATDEADLGCQRACRVYGGPLVDLTE